MKKIVAMLLLLAPVLTELQAQQYLGIRSGNFAGINGAYLNPSSIVDGRIQWDVNLASGNVTFDNTFLYIPKDSLKFFGFGRIVDLIKDGSYNSHYDASNPNEKFDATVSGEVLGPSFMFNFAKKHAIGVTTGARYYNVFSDVPGHVAENAYQDMRDESLWGINWTDNSTQYNTLGWFEYGLNYALEIYREGHHQLTGGIGLKYLQAAGGYYVKNSDYTYNIVDDNNLLFTDASIDYGGINYNDYEDIDNYKELIHGNGLGMNLGFTYYHLKDSADFTYEMDCKTHVDPNKSKYVYRLGASLIDLGSVTLDDFAENFHLEANSANWPGWKGENFTDWNDFNRTLSYIFYGDSSASFRGNDFKMALPVAISLQGDWNVYKSFYLNGTLIKGIGHASSQGVRRPDVYSVVPRFETNWFEVSVPMSLLVYNSVHPRIGVAVRAGWFYAGSDAIGGLMGINDLEGADFYAGVHAFWPGTKLKDGDGDGVSDKNDLCPTEKGTCLTQGCPDRDMDGIVDKDDECPDDPGPAEFKGCPDRDGDKLIDKRDSCPDDPGPIELNGCPDRDGDGIIDKYDECPDIPGLPQFNGCPDTDGDGLPDPKDECPLEAGPISLNGCPDRDGDGVIDKLDACPDEPGPKENNGCPLPQPALDSISMSSQFILFKTGSSIIEPRLFQTLDVLAELMKRYPNQKWVVEGHADNTGSDRINDPLSERRAESVKEYLVRKGVKSDNVSVIGYGSKKPISSNSTAAGRSKNRRAEVKPAR
jgi:outer membrane protein OmpA-like peptidoglycan-associated protein